MKKFIETISALIVTMTSFFILIPLATLFGYLVGWILNITVGDWISGGLNLLFNTTRFTTQQLPIIFATLASITGYFKTKVEYKN